MAVSAADKLKRAKKISGKKESSAKKTELRVCTVDAKHHSQIRKVCTLGFLSDQMKSPMEQNKKSVQNIFFEMWTAEMFKNQNKPDNFRVLLPKLDAKGKPLSSLDDVKCTFMLKFRAAGISKKVPKEDDLPEGQTLQEVLIDLLKSEAVGLSAANAKKFVSKEIEVTDQFVLAKSLDKMLESKEGSTLHNVGDKIISYMQARSTDDETEDVVLPAFTDEEEAAALVTVQTVSLKAGMLDRIFTYCKNIGQLRKLLTYCDVTLQVSDFDFGMSDEPAAKVERIKEAIVQYLVGEDA